MAEIAAFPTLGMTITLRIDEREARFLEALFSYGTEKLIAVAYEQLGTHYIKPFAEDGLRFGKTALPQIQHALSRIDRARKAFEDDGNG